MNNLPITTKRHHKSRELHDWGLELLGIPSLWAQSKGEGIKVAVLDTGAALKHPDLKAGIAAAKDFTGEGLTDPCGHGTHTAGIIGARANNIGVIGIAPHCSLIVAKVLGRKGGAHGWILKGMQWAIEQGADVISMSLGSPQKIRGLDVIMNRNRQCYYVAAIGNNGVKNKVNEYPACYNDVIAVGSIDQHRRISSFSSQSKFIDVVAPGSNVLSTFPPSRYMKMSGTSMATPFVAGVMALCLAKHRKIQSSTPIVNREQMIQHLRKATVDLGPKGKDMRFGYGLINPAQCLI